MSVILDGLGPALITRGLGGAYRAAILVVRGLMDRGGAADTLADTNMTVQTLSDVISGLNSSDFDQLSFAIAEYLDGIDGSQDRLSRVLDRLDMSDLVNDLMDQANDILAILEADE